MVLTSAMDARIIAGNPLTGLRLPKGSSRSRDALTIEQVEALAAAVDPWWRPFVLVLAYCGLRPGEAIALRRNHLDDLGRLTIERGMIEHRGKLLEWDTKTHRSRVVEVPASVLAELRTHVEVHVGNDPKALLFTTPTGDPVRLSNWRHRVWDPLAFELRLPQWATPYVLRHTAASLLAQSGVSVTAAAASLGHDRPSFSGPTRTSIRATSPPSPTPWTPHAPLSSMRWTTRKCPIPRRQAQWRAWISRGWQDADASRPRSMVSDLDF